jgi:oligoribonuclease NrnB/cAMP/cGMP phosphodiesterase (DHH superfamily)
MRFVVASHGHCFDGLSSAVLFTRLMHERGLGAAEFEYKACGYGQSQQHPGEKLLVGDENAILDYRFSDSPKLTWYFDHHRTAFQSEAERDAFQASQNEQFFFDSAYSSCTKLIADTGKKKFGFSDPLLDPLVRFADIIDSARFDSPEQAIDRNDPLMRLVSVVEHYGDDSFYSAFVPELLKKSVNEVAASSAVSERYKPLGKKHERFVERVREKSEVQGRVVFVDLTEAMLESVGKFVTYALYPKSMYSVLVGVLKGGPKISVGYNPWSGQKLDADISAICARYGGGGHPVVGGISFGVNEVERARLVAHEIAKELAG